MSEPVVKQIVLASRPQGLPTREHETEQGQVVERYAEGREDRERSDQRDRDCQQRYDRRSDVLQEDKHNQRNQY